MIVDGFDARTLANMEVALERACTLLAQGGDRHEDRRYLADAILQCAQGGDKTLHGLTKAGAGAAAELNAKAA